MEIHLNRYKEICNALHLLAKDTELHNENTGDGIKLTQLLVAFGLDLSGVGVFFVNVKSELLVLTERGHKMKEEIRLFSLEIEQKNFNFIKLKLASVIDSLDELLDNMENTMRHVTDFVLCVQLVNGQK